MPHEVISLLQRAEESGLLTWAGILLVSGWAGAVRYLSELKGRKIKRKDMMIEIFVSGFVGTITGLLCAYYSLPLTLSYAITGISAHYGTRSLHIIAGMLKKNSNPTPKN